MTIKTPGAMCDSKLTFERHIYSISPSIAQRIGLLRKSLKVFGDQDVLFLMLQLFHRFLFGL